MVLSRPVSPSINHLFSGCFSSDSFSKDIMAREITDIGNTLQSSIQGGEEKPLAKD